MVGFGGVEGVATATGIVSILSWTVFSLYLAGELYWLYEMGRYGIWYSPPSRKWGPSEIQVRILTVNNESVVRETVRRLPESFAEVYVIAEEPMDVPGADVRVVPESFECEATDKGRALEWARQALTCDREYILFLDEDSHLLEFGGLPDADIVQFREQPRKTNGWLPYFCEINRIGFQIEQRAFPQVDVPLYAWGGGIAIRATVEDEITWDYRTVIEDTVFVWRAFTELEGRPSFSYIPDRISNQAPPNVPEMFHQRRRWIAGSREDNDILSVDRIMMYGIRDLSWSLTAVLPVIALLSMTPGVDIVFAGLYRLASLFLLGFMFVWIGIGIARYRLSLPRAVLVLVLSPFTTFLHSIGALWGIVSTPDSFEVTEKVTEPEGYNERPTSQTGQQQSAD